MFDLWCPVAGCAVLRWSSDIVAVTTPHPGKIDVLLRCDCGELAVVKTGRARERAQEIIHGVDSDVPGRRARRRAVAVR